MQRCQNAKFLMESNGVVTYLDGWGMSIATQRAKEHENWTPGAKVMAEMVKCRWLILGGAGARGEEGKTARGCGHPGFGVQAPGVVSGGCTGGPGARGLRSGCPGVSDLGGNSWEDARNWGILWR